MKLYLNKRYKIFKEDRKRPEDKQCSERLSNSTDELKQEVYFKMSKMFKEEKDKPCFERLSTSTEIDTRY